MTDQKEKPLALSLLGSQRPRTMGWVQAAGLLFGDWGTSRLYVLGLALLFAGRTSFVLVGAMSVLIICVAWAYTQICRIYPDGGGVYTAARRTSRLLAVVGALLLFADYTVTASLSVLDGFHYFGLPVARHAKVEQATREVAQGKPSIADAGSAIHVDQQNGTGVDLDRLPPGFTLPKYLKPPVEYDTKGKQLRVDGVMHPYERDKLLALSSDPQFQSAVHRLYDAAKPESLWEWDSPGLWAILAIIIIGAFNLLGPGHTGAFAIVAAVGMIGITLLITVAALCGHQFHLNDIRLANPFHDSPGQVWVAFVSIVLALSGVEAIANLTGVMKRPVAQTASRAIWVVAIEVAVFNIILALAMLAIFPLDRSAHLNDMLAYLTGHYVGRLGEWPVRIIGGLLLLSAGNTAINGMMSILYVVSRDGEIPRVFQKVNRYGAPWVAGVVAVAVPVLVLILIHDLEDLAALYAIGVVGAVSINVTLCAFHPRLRRMRRKIPMILLGILLLAIWITLALTKLKALAFVSIVLVVGLSARAFTKWIAKHRGDRPSLLRQAIMEQLPSDALLKPKLLLGTYGSDKLVSAALEQARVTNHCLVVCFIRQVKLGYTFGARKLNIDTDLSALKLFAKILDMGHELHVPVLPVYDSGPDAAEIMAETAAVYGCERVLIGTSRQNALYHFIKGNFQERLEGLLPEELQVQVLLPLEAEAPPEQAEEPPDDAEPKS